MSETETVATILAVALAAWSLIGMLLVTDRVDRWYVRHSGNRPGRMVMVVVVTHCAWIVAWGAAWAAGEAISDVTGSAASAAWVFVPMLFLYLPFITCFLPGKATGYWPHRYLAEGNGADRPVARAMFWTGGPLAFVGLLICFAAFAAIFGHR